MKKAPLPLAVVTVLAVLAVAAAAGQAPAPAKAPGIVGTWVGYANMRRTVAGLCVAILAFSACGKRAAETPAMDNPFFAEFATPFGAPPFDLIKPEHYMPALGRGTAERKKEVAAIVADPAAPAFANTVEALERSSPCSTGSPACSGT